ncbi:MAG: hypothetical protein NTX16_05030 [Actinobacteria bacterium]|nr:hypothetical protein [Actinomycetota bacterium]
MSPRGRPGDPGWKPSDQDILAAQAPRPQFALRLFSVLPFILFGAFSVIALVAWIAVVVFGAGTSRGAVWQWAAGRSVGEVLSQLALAVVIGLIPVGVAVLSMWATLRGFSGSPALFFWLFTEVVFAAAALVLVLGRVQWPEFMASIALKGTEWWFAFVVVAYSMTMAHLRVRRDRRTLAVEDEDG